MNFRQYTAHRDIVYYRQGPCFQICCVISALRRRFLYIYTNLFLHLAFMLQTPPSENSVKAMDTTTAESHKSFTRFRSYAQSKFSHISLLHDLPLFIHKDLLKLFLII